MHSPPFPPEPPLKSYCSASASQTAITRIVSPVNAGVTTAEDDDGVTGDAPGARRTQASDESSSVNRKNERRIGFFTVGFHFIDSFSIEKTWHTCSTLWLRLGFYFCKWRTHGMIMRIEVN